MPKLSDTMEEGRILRWLKKEGDAVETGQALAEVETDKATVEMEAYANGTIRKLITPEGQFVKIGELIAIIGDPGEDVSALVPPAGAATPASAPHAAAAQAQAAAAKPAQPAALIAAGGAPSASGRSLKASPLALRMAAEAGLDVGSLQGTGPQGPHHQARYRGRALTQAPQPPLPGRPRRSGRVRCLSSPPAKPDPRARTSSSRRSAARSPSVWSRARAPCRIST
jgi:pyruvate dehydrogenase E2 component (dihydrolipoamide acetyltransferase)